jgi:hypothetical protein
MHICPTFMYEFIHVWLSLLMLKVPSISLISSKFYQMSFSYLCPTFFLKMSEFHSYVINSSMLRNFVYFIQNFHPSNLRLLRELRAGGSDFLCCEYSSVCQKIIWKKRIFIINTLFLMKKQPKIIFNYFYKKITHNCLQSQRVLKLLLFWF